MSLKDDLFRYLDHFGETITVGELAADPGRRDAVALRHDVDYDLDLALELAFWEHRRGRRATFYLLDTAPYWQDPRLVEKSLQLQDFGHEVGLHLDVLSKWSDGSIDDVAADVAGALGRLREGGVAVEGCAAHGSPRCYEAGFINYWCLAELRPEDPAAREDGLSAEGVPAEDESRRIAYPADHILQRADGGRLPLWSVSMAGLGLAYEATHVAVDRYFTDTGGSWKRSPDPLEADLRRGRHQVTMHPIYWRGPQRIWLFLSAARSGSLWLSRVLDDASSAAGRHEFTLNHRYDGETLRPEKRTFTGFRSLLDDPEEARSLMFEAREHIEDQRADWAEANVYLAHLLPQMDGAFPDATLVHLHRNPREVVRSLINRDWFDTPDDPLHPPVEAETGAETGQFERACWYVRRVNEALLQRCRHRLSFETMTTSPEDLFEALADLGIASYPRLAAPLMQRPLNASRRHDFPPPAEWSEEDKASFAAICGEICAQLGYEPGVPARGPRPAPAAAMPTRETVIKELERDGLPGRPGGVESEAEAEYRLGMCEVDAAASPGTILLPEDRHAHLVFGRGTWHQAGAGEAVAVVPGAWYRGEIEVDLEEDRAASLMCLMYDADGRLMDRRTVASLSASGASRPFAFRPRPVAARFNLALYFPKAGAPSRARLRRFRLVEVRPQAAR